MQLRVVVPARMQWARRRRLHPQHLLKPLRRRKVYVLTHRRRRVTLRHRQRRCHVLVRRRRRRLTLRHRQRRCHVLVRRWRRRHASLTLRHRRGCHAPMPHVPVCLQRRRLHRRRRFQTLFEPTLCRWGLHFRKGFKAWTPGRRELSAASEAAPEATLSNSPRADLFKTLTNTTNTTPTTTTTITATITTSAATLKNEAKKKRGSVETAVLTARWLSQAQG